MAKQQEIRAGCSLPGQIPPSERTGATDRAEYVAAVLEKTAAKERGERARILKERADKKAAEQPKEK